MYIIIILLIVLYLITNTKETFYGAVKSPYLANYFPNYPWYVYRESLWNNPTRLRSFYPDIYYNPYFPLNYKYPIVQ